MDKLRLFGRLCFAISIAFFGAQYLLCGRRAGTGRQKRRWKSRSTNARRAEAYPCVLAGLVPANCVASTPSTAENLNHQRYQSKDQKQMNQKARDMVHDEASNPSKNQQHSNTQPNEPPHKLPHPW